MSIGHLGSHTLWTCHLVDKESKIDQDKPHKDSSGMRRSFPKMYRIDPATMSAQQLHKVFMEILEAGAVVPFTHPFRKYLLNVVDVLFGGEMPPCIARLRDQDDFISDLICERDVI
ncbi:hypothetical protein Aduo_018600 [Ancylostoma duodenale]